jgi:DNA segregation ATPase FtsK/SpoIIIE-like protein
MAPLLLPAQTPAVQTAFPSNPGAAKPVHRNRHSSPVHTLAVSDPVVPATVAPPVPEAPKWPAFDRPIEASVVWDSHGLSIDAANSSLEQILKDVSMATGAEVEGLSSDQRVFGVFGPGPAREVLSQVLQGSGYNVIMIGDQGQGTPRQILLSVRQASASQPIARNMVSANEDEDADEPQQPAAQEPISNRPGFPGGIPSRSPQQIMQEMQQRQQQMQQGQQMQPGGQQAPATPPGNYQPNPPVPPSPQN